MIETGGSEDFFKEVVRRGLFSCPIKHFFDAGVCNGAGTHWARLKRDEHCAIFKTPIFQFFARFVNGDDLSMVKGVFTFLPFVETTRDDFVTTDNHRTDWHLIFCQCFFCEADSLFHKFVHDTILNKFLWFVQHKWLCFEKKYDIILSMEKSKKVDELQKVFQKRNFYVTKDAGKIFLYALLLPLAVGLLFGYISIAIAKGTGVKIEESTNVIGELCQKFLWFSIPYMLLTQVVFLGLYFSYNKANRIEQKSCNLSFKKANIWTCLLSCFAGIVAFFGFLVLIEGVFGNLFHAVGIESSGVEIRNNTVGFYFLNLLLLGIVPPICEELIFRGMIFQGLKERFKPFTSVVLTALLFALMHQNVSQFIYPLLLGFVLTVVMDKTNNLLYPMLIHAFNNITTVTIDFLQNRGVIKFSFLGMKWWMYLLGFAVAFVTAGILFVIYKFYLIKRAKITVEEHGEAPLPSSLNVGKLPLSLFLGILISIIMIVINAL